MMVLTLSKCPQSLRGDLSKWLMEISTGVYVGNPPVRVRDLLWQRVKETIRSGNAVLVYSARCEQGFEVKSYHTARFPKDFEGITLMFYPNTEAIVEQMGKPTVKVPVYTETQLKRKMKSTQSQQQVFPKNFVVLDFETTGLDPQKDGITEIGALRVDRSKIQEEFSVLVKSNCQISPEASQLTGITYEMLEAQGIDECDALIKLRDFIGDLPVICHNARFDLEFLKNACVRSEINYWIDSHIDTLALARKYVKGLQNYRLQTLLDHFGINCIQKHRALSDCKITLMMVEKLKKFI